MGVKVKFITSINFFSLYFLNYISLNEILFKYVCIYLDTLVTILFLSPIAKFHILAQKLFSLPLDALGLEPMAYTQKIDVDESSFINFSESILNESNEDSSLIQKTMIYYWDLKC